MGEVYTATLKEATRIAKKKLADAERNYSLLIDKESEFAEDILTWIEVRRKIVEVYEGQKELI